MKKKLLKKSDRNIATIIKATPQEGKEGEAYRNVARLWEIWFEQRTIIKESQKAFYIYKQVFEIDEQKYVRYGIIGRLRLAEFGKGVMAHEKTLEGPKADRLNLLRATNTNFGQVFLLYSDEENTSGQIISESITEKPLFSAADDDGVEHHLYAIFDEKTQNRLQKFFEDKPLFIADGHHRYETALNYMNENPDIEAAKFRMVTLVSMHQEGLVILPTHRLLSDYPNFDFDVFRNTLSRDFYIAQESNFNSIKRTLNAGFKSNRHVLGIATGNEFYSLTLKSFEDARQKMQDIDDVEAELDVMILHILIFEKQLRITEYDIAAGRYITFIKGYFSSPSLIPF